MSAFFLWPPTENEAPENLTLQERDMVMDGVMIACGGVCRWTTLITPTLPKRLFDHLETRLSPLELLMKVYPKWFKKAYWPTSNLEEETSIGTWNQ